MPFVQPTPSNNVLLLKPPEAAKMLAISTRTLWTLTKRGDIKSVRLGRSVRYPVDKLQQYIAELVRRSA